jgi:hypothetical protein
VTDLATAVEIVITYVSVIAPMVLIVRLLDPERVEDLLIPPATSRVISFPPEEQDPPRWRLELIGGPDSERHGACARRGPR